MSVDGSCDVAEAADVVVVCYGPAGRVTAALLGRAGHRMVVLERHEGLCYLPWAASFDDETMRIFARRGIAMELPPEVRSRHGHERTGSSGKVLAQHRHDEQGSSGRAKWTRSTSPILRKPWTRCALPRRVWRSTKDRRSSALTRTVAAPCPQWRAA
ncbi:FAD-dependent monooxygenase [Amycolatopsis sp. H20-H5]|uniref:FAD-dependent monooxygenase n=1 Tax=Amycolatopsis sp. H20-H5 TaxID=3046309 RepID=UPI002DBD68E5|nr:FAD-dependent monooxygenase [Amycolatopsis sp. H20-H5]MEC3974466.1 FAD-dependent monooxygenase [Amycolatopsis sp. H20-H5]